MDIIIISAVAKNNVIGKDGDIPWRIKEDFLHFKELTIGSPCIMGKNTYESLPVKPLPKRENIVLTRNPNYKAEGVIIMNSFESALKYCEEKGFEKVFIIGGSSIYKQGLEFANVLELTHLKQEFEGDTYFPEVNYDEWNLISKEEHEHEKYGKYSFCRYEKKQ